jgi:imidazolonepropionase-like amidohydrolase
VVARWVPDGLRQRRRTALGVADQIGTVEPGKLADLTFVGGDPLMDIRNTRDVKRVMRGGRLFSVADLVNR